MTRRASADTPLEHIGQILPRVLDPILRGAADADAPITPGSCAEHCGRKAARFDLFCPACRAAVDASAQLHGVTTP